MKRVLGGIIALVLVAVGAAAYGEMREQDFFGGRRQPIEISSNLPYDGRITFVRVSYSDFNGFGRRREPPWMHDYPTSDTHMMKILNELTLARPHLDGSN